jgi:hypothetical protein
VENQSTFIAQDESGVVPEVAAEQDMRNSEIRLPLRVCRRFHRELMFGDNLSPIQAE